MAFLVIRERKKWNKKKCDVGEAKVVRAMTGTIRFFLPLLILYNFRKTENFLTFSARSKKKKISDRWIFVNKPIFSLPNVL